MCFSTASCFGMFACAWITAVRTVVISLLLSRSSELGDDLLAVRLDDRIGALDGHGVDVELVHAQPLEGAQLLLALVDGPDHAEPIDDLVGHELGVFGPAAPVIL